jgi:RNA polymerase sigma-70 factor (ECF subfamily)
MGPQQPPPHWHWHSLDERELEHLYGGDDDVAAERALVELRWRHDAQLRSQACRECGRSCARSEEALVRLDEKLSKQRKKYTSEQGCWISWARKVLHNIIIDLYRKRPPVPFSVLQAPIFPSQEPRPDCSSKLAELKAAMDDCLGRLSPEERIALRLQVLERASLGKIAEVAGVPAPTIGSRVHRARQKMLACLKRKGYEGGEL